MADHIYNATISAIRSDRREGFDIEMISLCRGVPVESVRLILAGKFRNPPAPVTSDFTNAETAHREMKAAEKGRFGYPTALYVRAVKGNWCDIIKEWKEDKHDRAPRGA